MQINCIKLVFRYANVVENGDGEQNDMAIHENKRDDQI